MYGLFGYLYCLVLFAWSTAAKQPNIIFILTDDQDRRLGSLDYMPQLQRHVVAEGLTSVNHYGTVALCCPARATLFRGQAAHNTNITHVGGPGGGYHKFLNSGEMDSYLPKWLSKAGYQTGYLGKFMNGYGVNARIPEGWTELDVLISPYIYNFNHVVMKKNNEKPVFYDGWHQLDVMRLKTLNMIEKFTTDEVGRKVDKPFFVEVAPASPHVRPGGHPTAPLKRHKSYFPGITAPRLPNWNPDDDHQKGKPAWVGGLPQMNESVIEVSDASMRARLQALQGVDEIVEDIFKLLERKGILENTFVIYTTDNGFHIGQHRVPGGKGLPYIEDVNLPFAVRGPGIAPGQLSTVPQTHVDIAPTLLDIAGVPKSEWPPFFDGRSLLPEWRNAGGSALDDGIEREVVNVEYWGSATAPAGDWTMHFEENSYKSLRIVSQHGQKGYLFNRWCTKDQTELYDTVADPYELENLAINPDSETERLIDRLGALLLVTKSCGQDSCRKPWEVLSAEYASTFDAAMPVGRGQAVLTSNAFSSLSAAMDKRYDHFFANMPKFAFQMCPPYQLASNEGPFLPASSEDLGRKYRAEAVDFSYWLTNGTMAVEINDEISYGDLSQRQASINDLYVNARELNELEIGFETELCSAPDWCGHTEEA